MCSVIINQVYSFYINTVNVVMSQRHSLASNPAHLDLTFNLDEDLVCLSVENQSDTTQKAVSQSEERL